MFAGVIELLPREAAVVHHGADVLARNSLLLAEACDQRGGDALSGWLDVGDLVREKPRV